MPLVIYCLSGRHTDKHTHTQTYQRLHKSDFRKPGIHLVKLYYIKFNRLLSPVLLNKVGLTRAKAGYTN